MPIHPKTPKRVVHHIPITKARINLGQVVRRAHLNRECFILEKDGIPVAGLMNVDDMEDWLELQDPGMRKQIADGYAEYQRGDTTSLDDFLADMKKNQASSQEGPEISTRAPPCRSDSTSTSPPASAAMHTSSSSSTWNWLRCSSSSEKRCKQTPTIARVCTTSGS